MKWLRPRTRRPKNGSPSIMGDVNMKITTGIGILTGLAFVGGTGRWRPPPSTRASTSQPHNRGDVRHQQHDGVVNFGSLGVLGGYRWEPTTHPGRATVAVQCTDNTPFSIGLDGGYRNGGDTTTRKLAGNTAALSTATVNYKLYQNSGHHGTNWGNTVATDTVGYHRRRRRSHTYTVYGPNSRTEHAGARHLCGSR